MCDPKAEGGVRCAKHSPAARALSRATEKTWDCLKDLAAQSSAFWRETPPAYSRETAEPVLSRWSEILRKVLLVIHKTRINRAEKRVLAREVRQAEDLAFIERARQAEKERTERDEKRWGLEAIERANKAAIAVEEAAQAVEEAEDTLLDAEEDVACTLPPGDFALSPYEVVQFEYGVAQVDAEDAQIAYFSALEKQKPADLVPNPKTGLPSRKQQNLMRLKKEWAAKQRIERAWKARLEKTPTRKSAEAARDAAAARLESAKAELEGAKKERHAARCALRASSAGEVALAA